MKYRNRVYLFIDGSNFYFKLKELGFDNLRIKDFDYFGLSQWLAGKRQVIQRNYYVGVVKARPDNPRAQAMRRKQQQLFSYLESKHQKYNVVRGYLMENEGVFHEKGVDVRIAVDLIRGAYENHYDTALLLSSDTDLIPAIKLVRQKGKGIEYIGFSHKPSFALKRNANVSKLLDRDNIKQFIKPM